MSSKWKYFVKKYQNFCIASGIVGFLLAPFLWPFFLAILVNTLSLTVPVLLVYLVIRQLKKRPEGAEKETFKEVAENRKEKAEVPEEQSLKRAAPVVKAPKQEQTVKKKMEKERSPSVSEELNEAEKVARNWYIMEGRENSSYFHEAGIRRSQFFFHRKRRVVQYPNRKRVSQSCSNSGFSSSKNVGHQKRTGKRRDLLCKTFWTLYVGYKEGIAC